jgi:formylglycine-generating enzyme required for sulfatase activity
MSEMSQRPLRVFLCHASKDKPAVRDLHRRLTADGFAPWLDQVDLQGGQQWKIEIPKALRNSDAVLVCLSQHSVKKEGYFQKEIKDALDVASEKPDSTIFLIPLRLEECIVPDSLLGWQWVNFYEDDGYTRLLSALRQRAADLKDVALVSAETFASQPNSSSAAPTINNASGGVNVNAANVNVGNDMVGRDKIIHADTYIEHATIIQSGPTIQEIKPTTSTIPASTENYRVIGGMEFVRVPAGKFIMGSTSSDREKPQHTVEIPYDYWICKYPVTNEQFAEFVAVTHCQFVQGDWKPRAAHPVVNISWREALAYCQWLNQRWQSELKGWTLRLPTEAEWEKAARGTDGRIYPWGDDFDKTKCNTYESDERNTTPVGTHSPYGDSPYAVADMVGNVWEWCHSLDKPYPYKVDDGRENEAGDGARVLRGGSWTGDQVSARCAFRNAKSPTNRYNLYGFRYLLSPYKMKGTHVRHIARAGYFR